MKFVSLLKKASDEENNKNALASFLEIAPQKIKQIDNILDLPTFSVDTENGNEEYSITSDEKSILKAVANSLSDLFDGLTIGEFVEKVLPYIGSSERYFTLYDIDEDMSLEEAISNGFIDDSIRGYKFHGFVDFDKMAQDVIDTYGAGHELSQYDGVTEEFDYNGKTYYIFRQS